LGGGVEIPVFPNLVGNLIKLNVTQKTGTNINVARDGKGP